MIYLLPFLGAFLSRLHGSDFGPSKVARSVLWAIPFTALPAIHYYKIDPAMVVALVLICMINALGKSTGHGNFFDLGTWDKTSEDERLEFLIKGLRGKINRYWYDVLGLVVTGIAAIAGSAVALFFVNPIFSVIMVLAGALKGTAYMIGWRFSKNQTEIGEVLTGFFAYTGYAICLEHWLRSF